MRYIPRTLAVFFAALAVTFGSLWRIEHQRVNDTKLSNADLEQTLLNAVKNSKELQDAMAQAKAYRLTERAENAALLEKARQEARAASKAVVESVQRYEKLHAMLERYEANWSAERAYVDRAIGDYAASLKAPEAQTVSKVGTSILRYRATVAKKQAADAEATLSASNYP